MNAKIYALEGDWLGKTYYKHILPRLSEASVPISKTKKIPLTSLDDERYWNDPSLSNSVDIAVLDHRHWYFDDEVFEKYVRKIATIEFKAVCLGECPFGFERPPQVDIQSFESKLYDRMKLASTVIRQKQKSTIIPPAVHVLDDQYQEIYLDFFIHNRALFDVWSLHCCYDMTEQKTAVLTSFLNQLLITSRREVWVTKWAVPSCEHAVHNPNAIISSSWTQPFSYTHAAGRMRHIFGEIESICDDKTKWFFCGTGQDAYHPAAKTPDPLWRPYSLFLEGQDNISWGFQHFLGSITHTNEIKEPVINTFLQLADEHNELPF